MVEKRTCFWLLLAAETLEIKLQPSDLPESLVGTCFTSLLYHLDIAPLLASVMPDNPTSQFARSLGGKKVRYVVMIIFIPP